MTAALPFVDMFNPQVYWHHHPNKKMVKQFKRPNGKAYATDDAAEYAELCLDRWDKLMGATTKELVITGQSWLTALNQNSTPITYCYINVTVRVQWGGLGDA